MADITDLTGDEVVQEDTSQESVTIADLTGDSTITTDEASVFMDDTPEDSNINVYEFGNLILADILPVVIWLINYIADLHGTSLDVTDRPDGSGIRYVETDITYSQSDINYSGYRLLLISDFIEEALSILDFSGDSVESTDITVDVMTISDWSGDSVSVGVESSMASSIVDMSGS